MPQSRSAAALKSHPFWMRLGVLVLITVGLWMGWGNMGLRAAESTAALEYKVKGGYLFNFAKFIEWPSQEGNSKSFVIGVMDTGDALPVLQQLFVGKTINGRSVEVRSVNGEDGVKGVHILMVAKSAGKTPEDIRTLLGNAATLLVGETDQFAEKGGVVGFVREDESIRITLNLERAAEVGLKVSAKLASVAKVVKSKSTK